MSGAGSWGTIGPDSPIDELLADYFGELPEGWAYELFEDETNALLAALLIEQSGRNPSETASNLDAVYYSSGEDGLDVTDEEQSKDWDFTATSVALWGWEEPILVAFKDQNRKDRWIPLPKNRATLSFETTASEVWYTLQDGAQADTTLNVLAVVE
jgi:hypothetical protein